MLTYIFVRSIKNECDFWNHGTYGRILCAVGNILFDLKGRDNKKLGTSGNIDINWEKMSYWRFGASVMFAFAGDILAGFGYFSLVRQIGETNTTLAGAVCVIISILTGALSVPKWFILLNPVVFLIAGVVFRKINPDKFCQWGLQCLGLWLLQVHFKQKGKAI